MQTTMIVHTIEHREEDFTVRYDKKRRGWNVAVDGEVEFFYDSEAEPTTKDSKWYVKKFCQVQRPGLMRLIDYIKRLCDN